MDIIKSLRKKGWVNLSLKDGYGEATLFIYRENGRYMTIYNGKWLEKGSIFVTLKQICKYLKAYRDVHIKQVIIQ